MTFQQILIIFIMKLQYDMVCKSTQIPRFPECAKWCVRGSFFSASMQELGMRLPVITFGQVLAVTLCFSSAQTYNILVIDSPFQVVLLPVRYNIYIPV